MFTFFTSFNVKFNVEKNTSSHFQPRQENNNIKGGKRLEKKLKSNEEKS